MIPLPYVDVVLHAGLLLWLGGMFLAGWIMADAYLERLAREDDR